MEIKIEFFSQQMRNLREEHQLTQEELAHQLGVSRQSIISLERGRCLPSLPLALSLADLFDLVLEDILRPTQTNLNMQNQTQINEPLVQIAEQENNYLAQIKLPENIDKTKIEVELKDDLLVVTLPKVAVAPKIIKIQIKNLS